MARVDCFGVHPNSARAEGGLDHQVGHPSEIRKRRPQAETRSAGCGFGVEVTNRKPLSPIWMPSSELRDLRTLLMHRHQWVRMRTRVQKHAASHGHRSRPAARQGPVEPNRPTRDQIVAVAAYRRTELQDLYQKLDAQIEELDKRVGDQALHRPGAKLLMSHPGVGPVTALATDVFLGDPARFADGKAVVSCVGMIPSEYSSGGQQRLGGLSKQGNPFLRFLWCEAAVHAARRDPDLQRFYRRKLTQKGLGKARVAVARKLGIRLYIILRDQIDYQEFCRRGQMRQKNSGACAGMPQVGHSPARQ